MDFLLSYSVWTLLVLHLLLLVQLVYFRSCHSLRKIQIFNINPRLDNNKTVTNEDVTYNPYMNFPNLSIKTVITAIRVKPN